MVISLTERGEEAVAPDTGDVRSAGKDGHDDAVFDTEAALVNAGFEVTIVTQDGSEQPDALATHPNYEEQFAVEVETTAPDRPNKILANLRKAQQADQIPLFVVEPGETETQWAERVASILESPIKRDGNDERVFYTLDAGLQITDRRTDDDPIAIRPVTGEDDSRRTEWAEHDGEYVLTDGEGTEHARIADIGSVTGRQLPAIVTYDETANEYVVETETDQQVYESKEAFQAEWVTVKQPILPDRVLPTPDYGRDTYAIVILDPDGEAILYNADGSTSPLATIADRSLRLPDALASDEPNTHDESSTSDDDQANAAESDGTDSSPADTPPDDNEVGESFEEFVEAYLTKGAEADVPKDEVHRVYAVWAAQRGLKVQNRVWLSRRLGEAVDLDTSRRRVDGDRINFYTGIGLAPAVRELIEQDASLNLYVEPNRQNRPTASPVSVTVQGKFRSHPVSGKIARRRGRSG